VGGYFRPEKSEIQTVALGTNDATAVTAGDAFACVLRRDGGVSCWGGNEAGQRALRVAGRGATAQNQHQQMEELA
jgi:alpha-tubulin suppressor-like RCC1 family protein